MYGEINQLLIEDKQSLFISMPLGRAYLLFRPLERTPWHEMISISYVESEQLHICLVNATPVYYRWYLQLSVTQENQVTGQKYKTKIQQDILLSA